MKNILNICVAALIVFSLNACSVTYGNPGFVTDNPVGDKEGRATVKILFNGLVLDGGDGSIKKAAEDGGITKISTVDYETKTGIFITRVTTIVTGE